MFFQHIYDKTLSQGSYLIGCQATGEAIVIDAKRDIGIYLDIAKQNNLSIRHITETHIHADYLCGSRELAAATGATMYLSDEGGEGWLYEFPHKGVKDGDIIKVGNLSFEVIHTPGHTPESISFLLTDHPASSEPVMVFTGDFVFVGDVGRPDLLEKAAGIAGTKEVGARQMFNSLKKFKTLPDYVQVWPAHGAGSACGKALGAVPGSTVGYEKIRNWALQYDSEEQEFVDALLADQPEPPKYFAMMKHLNKVKRPLLVEVPKYPILTTDQILTAISQGIKIIDTRNKTEFLKAAIPGSINIQNGNSLSTWAGWLVNYQEQFMIVANETQHEDITRKLMRIGLDNVYGFITRIDDLGIELTSTESLTTNDVKNRLGKSDVQLIDVRGEREYKSGHIEGADHVFVGTLPDHLQKIKKDKELVVYCQSGLRASIACSLLKRNGYHNVKIYPGSIEEWISTGNPVVSGKTATAVTA